MIRWIRVVIVMMALTTVVIAKDGHPLLYDSIGDELYEVAEGYTPLLKIESLEQVHVHIEDYVRQARSLKETGLTLDKVSTAESHKLYLADLRRLSQQKNELDSRVLIAIEELKIRQIEVDLVTLRENPYSLLSEAAAPEVIELNASEEAEMSAMNMQASLQALKMQLIEVRDDENTTLIECINDITAINYWILEVDRLRDEGEWCHAYKGTGQIVEFERSARKACGSEHPLFKQWTEHSGHYRMTVRKELAQTCE